jgi:oligoendopeptidase F
MATTLLRRDDVPVEHTWDLESVFPSPEAWEAEARAFEAELPAASAFSGKLAESSAMLLAWFEHASQLRVRAERLITYAHMMFDVDTSDQAAAALRDRAIGLLARAGAAGAFAEPELLALAPERLDALMAGEPALAAYGHYLDNLRRRAAHVRSREVEQLLAAAGDPLSAPYSAYLMLADGDLRFADAFDSGGLPHQVARGTIGELLQSPDRALRQHADHSYRDGFLALKNTFGAIYAGSVKADVFRAQAHGYASALEASLDANNVPMSVYRNVIDAYERHRPLWHRYWNLRRRALGLERMAACDIFAPLGRSQDIPYEHAVELVCQGVAPLGEEYVAVSRAGLTVERWVDIYPNSAKTSGAYSGGSHGTKPFILMNYDDSLSSVSTLAHELGHSMHSWLTNRDQPPIYSGYSLFVAEVASNFNQALLRGHLLRGDRGEAFELAVLEEALYNFHRYLFVMPILSQFEERAHALAESGAALTGDSMNALLAELLRQGYGPAVEVDEGRDGVTWALFPHLYENFYVYQYASGIAAANALAAGVLQGEAGAAERYLQFLSAGGSLYPLDALRLAGLDMTSPAPLDRAFGVLAGYIERMEQILLKES